MQLAAFNNNNFTLGHAAMMVNEGLPLYVVHRLEQRFDLTTMTVGILGMGFKAESDDPRSSLSYKLKRILRFRCAEVLCSDPYVSKAVDAEHLQDEALKIARKLAGGSRSAITQTKRALNHWLYAAWPAFEASLNAELMGFAEADAREGLAAMVEKRAPRFGSGDA